MTDPPPSSNSNDDDSRPTNDSTLPPGPRQKVAPPPLLNRGFGLHDWKRLLASSKDLAQRKGTPIRRDIPLEEIQLHNKEWDGWMILRGKVYNIGPYLAYHPGGARILKGYLGKDGTKMFDRYHSWVNLDGLIGPLLLGTVEQKARNADNSTARILPPAATRDAHRIDQPQAIPRPQQPKNLASLLPRPDDEDEDDETEQDLLSPS